MYCVCIYCYSCISDQSSYCVAVTLVGDRLTLAIALTLVAEAMKIIYLYTLKKASDLNRFFCDHGFNSVHLK